MLSKFPNKTLKVGAKVSLSPQSEMLDPNRWGGPEINPLGVTGEVTRVDSSNVFVKWSNGVADQFTWGVDYNLNDYDLIAEGEPGYLEV